MPHLGIVLKGYPRLSETFIAQEIHALEQAGVRITLYSLRRPTDPHTHPLHRAIRAPVVYLPEYLHREPRRVLRAWWHCRRRHRYRTARQLWWQDWRRDRSANRARRFGQALVLAAEMPADIRLIYAHFLHTPASVARYASALRHLPWSVSAHAKDIWTLPDWEKREKILSCHRLTTCTRAAADHLRALTPTPSTIALNYHGLDLTRFPPPPPATPSSPPPSSPPPSPPPRDGSDPAAPVQIISVGRAVAKKGYRGLLDALAALPPTLHWRLTHLGGGPLLAEHQRHAQSLGIATKIRWLGAQPQQTVLAAYRTADIFALNCTITEDGDRDGLPNVLLEAQSQRLPIISTHISGVPELITNGVNGTLIEPNNTPALTTALHHQITTPQLRHRLGQAGLETVTKKFDAQDNFQELYQLLIDQPQNKR